MFDCRYCERTFYTKWLFDQHEVNHQLSRDQQVKKSADNANLEIISSRYEHKSDDGFNVVTSYEVEPTLDTTKDHSSDVTILDRDGVREDNVRMKGKNIKTLLYKFIAQKKVSDDNFCQIETSSSMSEKEISNGNGLVIREDKRRSLSQKSALSKSQSGPIKIFQCRFCFVTQNTHGKLVGHVAEEHFKELYEAAGWKCAFCFKGFRSEKVLLQHVIKVHDVLKPFIKTYKRKSIASIKATEPSINAISSWTNFGISVIDPDNSDVTEICSSDTNCVMEIGSTEPMTPQL